MLPSGRVIEGDLACLDKQGNLILSNAQEHISCAAAADSSRDARGGAVGSSGGSGHQPRAGAGEPQQLNQLGMVLVPKAQQQEVSLRVTLAERAAMLSLGGE